MNYCWRKKSCTSWYVVHPIIYKVYISWQRISSINSITTKYHWNITKHHKTSSSKTSSNSPFFHLQLELPGDLAAALAAFVVVNPGSVFSEANGGFKKWPYQKGSIWWSFGNHHISIYSSWSFQPTQIGPFPQAGVKKKIIFQFTIHASVFFGEAGWNLILTSKRNSLR